VKGIQYESPLPPYEYSRTSSRQVGGLSCCDQRWCVGGNSSRRAQQQQTPKMKSTAFVSILAGTLAAAQRPNIAELPYCGQICITNMLALAPSLGCPVVDGRPNHACLCSNANFQYGVRDCTNQSCGPEDANRVLAFAAARCVGTSLRSDPALLSWYFAVLLIS